MKPKRELKKALTETTQLMGISLLEMIPLCVENPGMSSERTSSSRESANSATKLTQDSLWKKHNYVWSYIDRLENKRNLKP